MMAMCNENYMSNFKSPEEFIRHEICANRGTQNVIDKDELAALARSFGIEVDEKKLTKDEIYLCMRKSVSVEDIASHCQHLGVSSFNFRQKFGITHEEVKRMARFGFIKITGSQRIRLYGKYRNAALYSVFDYFRLSQEDVDEWLRMHPKGTRQSKRKR